MKWQRELPDASGVYRGKDLSSWLWPVDVADTPCGKITAGNRSRILSYELIWPLYTPLKDGVVLLFPLVKLSRANDQS